MSLLRLAFAYLWYRPLSTLINSVAIAAGVTAILIILGLGESVERTLLRPAGEFDLVVGAPGSETSLVLAALFHLDEPAGNISYSRFQRLSDLDGVNSAYPMAMGDSYRGFPLIGTSVAYLNQSLATKARPPMRLFPLAEGTYFANDFEVVAGSQAAANLGLKIGDTFYGSHGRVSGFAEHRENAFKVVGILKQTGREADSTLWTTLGSYWKLHTPAQSNAAKQNQFATAEPEVTFALLRVTKSQLLTVQRQLQQMGLSAARPAQTLQRLFDQLLHPIEQILLVYGYGIALVASLSMLATLYLATLVRRRELAILRAIGARPGEVLRLVLYEALLLLILGSGGGILGSELVGSILTHQLSLRLGVPLTMPESSPIQLLALGLVFLTGLIAAMLPAVTAYRTEISRHLRRR